MAYSKPVCKCGGDLIYWVQVPLTIEREINKNGTLSKRRQCFEGNSSDGVFERLKCKECSEDYYFDIDEKGRVMLEGKM